MGQKAAGSTPAIATINLKYSIMLDTASKQALKSFKGDLADEEQAFIDGFYEGAIWVINQVKKGYVIKGNEV